MEAKQSMVNAFMPSWLPSRRLVNALGFACCGLSLGFAYILQFHMGLTPCNLCIFQRLAMFALGIVFVLATLHNPHRWGARVYGILIALTAGVGIAIAGRHVWLQNLPADRIPECGPDLDYMLEVFSLGETIRRVLTGSGDCAETQWIFLGLTIPGWTLVLFVVLGLMGVARNWMRA